LGSLGEVEDLKYRVHEVMETTHKGVINLCEQDQECHNEKTFDSNYEENTQEVRASNIACWEEINESTDIIMGIEKSEAIEKSKKM